MAQATCRSGRIGISFKGQTSLEALIAFSVLLSALCILCFSAQGMAGAFSESVEMSAERAALSCEALLLDTAADALPASQMPSGILGIPAANGSAISSRQHPEISEPLFHRISISQDGKLYVQKNPSEPV